MSFYEIYNQVKMKDYVNEFSNISSRDVERALKKDNLDEKDLLALLSPKAESYLEEMAQKANRLTVQHFGKVILLFTPLYVSDYCVNQCKYCSFSVENKFTRKRLTFDEVEKEGHAIQQLGIKHLLLLTGESRIHADVIYLKECVERLKKYFSSLSIEIQPLETDEYRLLIESGIDGLTLYQEVYNEEVYKSIHVKGPKRDYKNRLDAPERGCKAGMKTVNIGALLGLDDWRKEAYFTGLHAAYLQQKYLETEIAVSFPRIRPHLGSFQPKVDVRDKNLVQAMLAIRLFLPRSGITLSTREPQELRDQLFRLGVTKMSAESSTAVGGYTDANHGHSQFETSDNRTITQVKSMLQEKGYKPIFKDWEIV